VDEIMAKMYNLLSQPYLMFTPHGWLAAISSHGWRKVQKIIIET
jgi:hypothetical protein